MTERSFDRIADAFLADGPVVLPDRVLDAAFAEVHRTRQRRVLVRVPRRFPIMNTFAKLAVAAVAVIALGVLGLNVLGPKEGGVGGTPAASPSPTVAPTATPAPTPTGTPDPTAPLLTGQFTSDSHGYSISYPATWSTRPATTPWTSGLVDFGHEGGDVVYDPILIDHLFLALASQPLGDRTRAEWEADVWQLLVDDDPASDCSLTAEPITIDGVAGVICSNVALVTGGGRGYFVALYASGDEPWLTKVYDHAWFASVLATMKLQPEDAVDAGA
jgi:hypothetical protein